MDFTCDLYCYENVYGGWTTHVASCRRVRERGDLGLEKLMSELRTMPKDKGAYEDWAERYRNCMKKLENDELKDIQLPHAGESFNDPTLEEFRDRLLYLRGLGYRFPDGVLAAIEEEIKDRDYKNEETQTTQPTPNPGD